jgi:hypothetical protein
MYPIIQSSLKGSCKTKLQMSPLFYLSTFERDMQYAYIVGKFKISLYEL